VANYEQASGTCGSPGSLRDCCLRPNPRPCGYSKTSNTNPNGVAHSSAAAYCHIPSNPDRRPNGFAHSSPAIAHTHGRSYPITHSDSLAHRHPHTPCNGNPTARCNFNANPLH